jgi:hypothetical protein
MALKVYTCAEHILQTFATKRTFSSLTVVLIPLSTHPIVEPHALNIFGSALKHQVKVPICSKVPSGAQQNLAKFCHKKFLSVWLYNRGLDFFWIFNL